MFSVNDEAARSGAGPHPRISLAMSLLVAAFVLPGPAVAQPTDEGRATDPTWTVGARLGPSSARGALADIVSQGWIGGISVERRILEQGLLRAEAAVQKFQRGGAPNVLGGEAGPELGLYHYTAGLGLELTDPVISRWDISLLGGIGGTYVTSSRSPTIPDYTGHRLTLRLSGRVGYDFSRSVTLYLRADAYQLVSDRDAPHPLSGSQTFLSHAAEIRLGF